MVVGKCWQADLDSYREVLADRAEGLKTRTVARPSIRRRDNCETDQMWRRIRTASETCASALNVNFESLSFRLCFISMSFSRFPGWPFLTFSYERLLK